jgi:hypothetical protein
MNSHSACSPNISWDGLLFGHLWKASKRQGDWIQVQSINWACGKQREGREMRKQFNATSNSHGSGLASLQILRRTSHRNSVSGRMWPIIPFDLHLLTLSPSSTRGSRCSNWEGHRGNMSTSQIKWIWKGDTSVLTTSGASQGKWAKPLIPATLEAQTRRVVVWAGGKW